MVFFAPMKILVTGAAGKIGAGLVTALHEAGHDVVASDVVYRRGLPVPLHLVDLLQPSSLAPLADGCDALVHLANHVHSRAAHPMHRVLSENMAMNSNVMFTAVDLQIRRIVFASSVQATNGQASLQPFFESGRCGLAYLPFDGDLPQNPWTNPYAMSKCFCEQMLQRFCEADPDLHVVSLRFPFIMHPGRAARIRMQRPQNPDDPRCRDGLTYLYLADSVRLMASAVEKMQPGCRHYFPAHWFGFEGMTAAEIAEQFLPDVPARGEVDRLVDLDALKRDFDWEPTEPQIIYQQQA